MNHQDFLGNKSPVVLGSVDKNTIAPVVRISDTPSIDFFNVSSYSFSGTCSQNDNQVSILIGGTLNLDTICNSNEWQIIGFDTSSLAEGSVEIEVSQEDFFFNRGQVTELINKSIALPPPSGLSRVSPIFEKNSDNTPEIQVSGVLNGETIRLYTDRLCSSGSLVAMGISSGNSINLISSTLPDGSHHFYATRQNGLSVSSCSLASTSYEVGKAFISTWETTTWDESITLPLRGSGGTFNFNFEINWGDGSPIENITDDNASHIYATPGIYTITMRGIAEAWSFTFGARADLNKILSIPELGDMHWLNFGRGFTGAAQLSLVNGGDVSNVTSVENMFANTQANPDVSSWDVSSVTSMSTMFESANLANPDVSNWDVSNVITMVSMFSRTNLANPDVSNWNVSSVIGFSNMFNRAFAANPDVSRWNTSSAVTLNGMFNLAVVANPDVFNWDVSNVVTMRSMFESASVANPDVSKWNVTNVTDMRSMFERASVANPDLSDWDFTGVELLFDFLSRCGMDVTNY